MEQAPIQIFLKEEGCDCAMAYPQGGLSKVLPSVHILGAEKTAAKGRI
jgi:hypothetical protein